MNESEAVASSAALATAALPEIHYVSPPAWIRTDPDPTVPDGALDELTDDGVLRVLLDRQVSLMEPGVATYTHVVQRALTRAGAERVANLAIEFDPDDERLEIHTIRIRRGGSFIEFARPGAMQLLRRETKLERLAINGRLTASIVVPELRVGDELEVAATHHAALAVLSGRHAGWLVFDARHPWLEMRLRLLHPKTRPIALKAFNSPPPPDVIPFADGQDLRWSLIAQKRLPAEDLVPPWAINRPCYQFSEFTTWNEVAQIFVSHYQADELPPEIEAARAAIAAKSTDPSVRAIEWLRFVQGALRYFALSFGDGRLLPRGLDTIWSQRFGDCKDAARLYVAGARALGLDACAALASTTHGLSLNEWLPAAQHFNHMIVRVRIGAETHWLDPTLPSQGGKLQQVLIPHAGWALPLTTETNALEALPLATPVRVLDCEDRLTLGKDLDSPGRLSRQMTFSYWSADNVRHGIADDGSSKAAGRLLQQITAHWPDAVESEPPTFSDDPESNQIIMRCGYEIRSPWALSQSGQGRRHIALLDTVTGKELPSLAVTQRHSPILLGHPRSVRWRATVQMPPNWSGSGWSEVLEAPGLLLTNNLQIEDTTVTATHEVIISNWSMPSDKAADYVRLETETRKNTIQLFATVGMYRIVASGESSPDRTARNVVLRVGVALFVLMIIQALSHCEVPEPPAPTAPESSGR